MIENLSPTTTANPRTNVITGRADAWIIDLDHIDSGLIGTWGPRSARAGLLEHLGTPLSADAWDELAETAEMPVVRRFRLYDDDGELYCSGRQIFATTDPTDEEEFGPLWDFGGPALGAVRLDYDDHGWKTL